jgi:hypothetical protein
VILVRRVLLVAAMVLFSTDATTLFTACTILNLLFLVLHTSLRPYREPRGDALESLSLFTLTLLTVRFSFFCILVLWDASVCVPNWCLYLTMSHPCQQLKVLLARLVLKASSAFMSFPSRMFSFI